MGSASPDEASVFGGVEYVPPDAIFELTLSFNADKDPRKVNLGQGTYKDGQGNPWILPAVRAAKASDAVRNANHEYLPILGLPAFRTLVTELIYGRDAAVVKESRVAASQSLSGTGALHLAGAVLYRILRSRSSPPGAPLPPVYITSPTWSNHRQVFETAGFTVKDFRWASPTTGRLDLPAILEDLSQAPPGSIIVLHACGHNPSACDPTEAEWRQIAAVLQTKGLLPLFDAAYLGITSGSYDADAFAIHHVANELQLETVVCVSFAKNMGLYSERVGHVSVTTKTPTVAQAVQSQLAQQTRAEISNPPAFGARIVAAVLGDEALRAQWSKDLATMGNRIASMRTALYTGLAKRNTPGNWKPILEQTGMFSVLGLPKSTVLKLRETHHIYMADSSRISIAGLNEGNVDYVAAALDSVLREAQG